MWVFGYGSLIWDDWEKQFNCDKRSLADLHGYRRTFNKRSVRNWGTWQSPCPTLNLLKDDAGCCRGVAFHLSNEQEEMVLAKLRQREGKNFDLVKLPISLTDNYKVQAHTPLYTGANLINDMAPENLANMIRDAKGCKGRCVDYIAGLAKALAAHGIQDPCVDALVREVKQ